MPPHHCTLALHRVVARAEPVHGPRRLGDGDAQPDGAVLRSFLVLIRGREALVRGDLERGRGPKRDSHVIWRELVHGVLWVEVLWALACRWRLEVIVKQSLLMETQSNYETKLGEVDATW